MATDRLNISLDIIRNYAASKRRKELLAFAIYCHIVRVNAVLMDYTAYRLRKDLKIGKKKADRLLNDISQDELFTVEGNKIRAAALRDKTIKYNRNGYSYQGCMVVTLHIKADRNYTLKELYDWINEVLIESSICAKEKRDNSNKGGKTDHVMPNSNELTLKSLSGSTRMSMSSTRNILKRLIAEGKLNKKPSAFFATADNRCRESMTYALQRAGRSVFTFFYKNVWYIVMPCSYSIADRSISENFKHKIHGYHKNVRIVTLNEHDNFHGFND